MKNISHLFSLGCLNQVSPEGKEKIESPNIAQLKDQKVLWMA